MRQSRQKAFTLIEIMIVVGIIALLAVVAVPAILPARRNANQMAAISNLKSLASSIESYFAITSIFPEEMSYLTDSTPSYFPYDITANPKDGYTFTASLSADGYTVTAAPQRSSTGSWDYRVRTGTIIERSTPSAGTWATF